MCLPIAIIPEEVIAVYNLLPLVNNTFVYILIQKGMHSLPHAGKLANDELINHLAPFDYQPTTHTPGLWTHKNPNISFILTVDNVGIKYTKMRDVMHLLNDLRTKYELSTDWTGSLYCGLTLRWDYPKATVHLYMHMYIATVLQKYNHAPPNTPNNLSIYFPPNYIWYITNQILYLNPSHQLYQNSRRSEYKKHWFSLILRKSRWLNNFTCTQ